MCGGNLWFCLNELCQRTTDRAVKNGHGRGLHNMVGSVVGRYACAVPPRDGTCCNVWCMVKLMVKATAAKK